MPVSKFADLHDRFVGNSPIQHIRASGSGQITIQTLDGQWYSSANLSHVYPKLDAEKE